MALPTALFAMVASMALAGAAVISSVDVQQGTHRDNGSKSAIGAADAGANVALLRLARESEELASAKCLGDATPSDGWCPPVEDEVGDASYEYQVSEPGLDACGEFELCVVATGTAADVSRRVMVNFCAGLCDGIIEGGGPGEGGSSGEDGEAGKKRGPEGIIGLEDIEIDNNGDARVSIGTNGNVHIHNNGNVCGNIRHGVGKKAEMDNQAEQCDGYEIFEGNVELPAVSTFMPSNISTVNSNYRLAMCTFDKKTGANLGPTGCQSDTYTKKWSSTVPWNPATTSRKISTANNESLTLGGGDYWICRLELSNNSHLIMAAGAKVRLFFDTPEHCGIKSGENQIYVSNGATITATGYLGTPGHFDMPGLYVMGSPSIPTNIEFKNNGGTNEFVLYAPQSHVELKQKSEFIGLIAGKTVHISENAIVDQPDGFELDPELIPWHTEEETPEEEGEPETEPAPLVFTAQYYVECTGPASPEPNSGC